MSNAAPWRIEAEMIVREYPKLREKKGDKILPAVTANYNGMPGSGTAHRTTEDVALKSSLMPLEERKLNAVEEALHAQSYFENADMRAKAVDLLYFRKKRFTIARVSEIVGFSTKAVQNWNTSFLSMVWANYLTK